MSPVPTELVPSYSRNVAIFSLVKTMIQKSGAAVTEDYEDICSLIPEHQFRQSPLIFSVFVSFFLKISHFNILKTSMYFLTDYPISWNHSLM